MNNPKELLERNFPTADQDARRASRPSLYAGDDSSYELAFTEKVFAAMAELQWFITEQVEEEKTVREIVTKLSMVQNDPSSILDLDRELGARAATPAE